jgi:hypothetical protein
MQPLFEFGRCALNLRDGRGVVRVVFDQLGQFNRIRDLRAQRLPWFDLAFQLLEFSEVRLRLLGRVPEVRTTGDLFEPLDFPGMGVEVKDTAGRERPALRTPSTVQSILPFGSSLPVSFKNGSSSGPTARLAREKETEKNRAASSILLILLEPPIHADER